MPMRQRVLYIEPSDQTHCLVGAEGLVWTQDALGESFILAADTAEDRKVAGWFITGLLGMGLVPYGIPANQAQLIATFGGDAMRDCQWVPYAEAPQPQGDAGDELPTRLALIIMESGSRRVQMLRAAAIEIVQASGVDVTVQVDILPLAKLLAKREDCTVKTAKIRIAEAVRRMRHPDWQPPTRGGEREGSGRPKAGDD